MPVVTCGYQLWDDLPTELAQYTAADLQAAFPEIARHLEGMYPAQVGGMRDAKVADYAQYRDKPVAYMREVLKHPHITDKQQEICRLLLTPPYKVIAVSANNTGKTFIEGSLINWRFDCWNFDSVTISTSHRKQDVEEVMWAQVRAQRRTRNYFRGDRTPELYDRADHYSKGYTGTKAEAFHGRHNRFLMFLLDEATALKPYAWQGIKSMFKGGGNHLLFAALNPTDTGSPAYAECESGNYHVVHMSALEHPNLIAELMGQEAPIPGAVDCAQVVGWLEDQEWFEEIHQDDFEAGDVAWPPPWADKYGALARYGFGGKRRFFRPTAQGQARVLGVWPSSVPGAVWSDVAWKAATRALPGMAQLQPKWQRVPQVGCDVAVGTAERSDKTSIFVQMEGIALEYKTGTGWDVVKTAGECMGFAVKWARIFNTMRDPRVTPEYCQPEHIPIKVDDGGVGHGVGAILRSKGFKVSPINAATVARDPTKYPLMRDQLWFAVPLAARRGEIDLTRLPAKCLQELRRQAMAQKWKMDLDGRRKVLSKDETIRLLGRSPDDMDGLNLSYCAPLAGGGGPEMLRSYQGPAGGGPPQRPGPIHKG